jgi:hypothetical protein
VRIAVALAALVFLALDASAQSFEQAPAFALQLSPSGMRALANDTEREFLALGAFGGKRAVDQFTNPSPARAQGWTLYGRLGVLNFQDRLDGYGTGTQIGFRRTGPALTGRVYLGIHRQFD